MVPGHPKIRVVPTSSCLIARLRYLRCLVEPGGPCGWGEPGRDMGSLKWSLPTVSCPPGLVFVALWRLVGCGLNHASAPAQHRWSGHLWAWAQPQHWDKDFCCLPLGWYCYFGLCAVASVVTCSFSSPTSPRTLLCCVSPKARSSQRWLPITSTFTK